ncbi:MAG: LytTR family DNA-binding domain-containing protein [Bacteroidales bacterium]|nr:LytTR family DNA-binding domain-containing protein [Bacteroidales bacterium]
MSNNTNRIKKRISFCSRNTEYLVSADKIIRIDIEDDLISAELINDERLEKIHLTSTLKKYEDKLQGLGFVRVNHQTLVNVKFISRIKAVKRQRLIMLNNIEIAVSRRKWPVLKQFIAQWCVN